MASPATVPMIDPNGTLGDIPQEQMKGALDAGGKIAIPMIAPDGSKAYVPHDQVVAAQKAGGKVDTKASETPTLMDTIKKSFGLGNLAKNAGQGVKELVGGVAELANYPIGAAVGMGEAAVDQNQKAKAAAGQGHTSEALGHSVAAALPGIGPYVADLSEQAGKGDVGGAVARAGSQVATGAAVGAAGKAAAGVAKGVREGAPAYFRSADELAGTTPERINELKTVPEKMAAVHKLAVDTEASAKAAAKAAYPEVKTPIVRTRVLSPGENTAAAQTVRSGANQGSLVVQESVPFSKVQEERAAIGEEIANEKRNVAKGAPAYELKSLTQKYGQLSDELRAAAQTDGKLKQFQAAEVKWKQFQNDFHNPGSAVQPLLKMQPDQTSAITNHLLNNDRGARTLQTLRKYGADTGGVEKVLSRGSTPLKVDVTESSKLQKAGSDSNYRAQRMNEALDQATTDRLPSGTEAKLPAAAMKSKAPGILDEVPGADILSPRNVTRFKLNRAVQKTLSGEK